MSQTAETESSNLFIPFALVLLPLLLILIFILKHFKTSSSSNSLPLPLPPGPNPWPLVGNLFQMGKNMPHITLSNFAKTYGPLISIKLGTQTMVVASSPDSATEILKTQDRVLSARYVPQALPLKRSELNNISLGWSFECGEGWKYLRTICRSELFSNRAIESQACLREENVMEMVKFIDGKEGKVVNIGEITFTCVFNMLSSILLSKNIFSFENDSCEGKELKALVRALMKIAATPNISDFYPILSRLDLQGIRRKSKELGEQINAYWVAIIKGRKENCSSRDGRDFLDVLIENNFSDARTNSLFQELFSAGTDTTSSTIEWAMAELIKNPQSMKKVVKELKREIKQDVVKESKLPQLTYLQACVKETLRLHPPAPLLLPHRAHESCQVMNYSVPKDSQVVVNVWAIARDPLYWEDPLTFKPERFLGSTLEFKGNDFEFLPFGAGRRICPGLPMAAKQVPFVLASLIHFFNWSLPHGDDPKTLDMSEKFGITLQKDKPLLLVPSPRVGIA